jgi:hypothetical protein
MSVAAMAMAHSTIPAARYHCDAFIGRATHGLVE